MYDVTYTLTNLVFAAEVEMDPSLGRANEEIGSGGADVGADGCNARAAGWAGEQRCGGGRARLMAPWFLRRPC